MNINKIKKVVSFSFFITIISIFFSCTTDVREITELKIINDKIFLIDVKTIGTRYPIKSYSLYIVNANNSKFLIKEKLGKDAKIVETNNEKLLIQTENKFLVYNCIDLKIETEITNEFLSQKFKELNEGVSETKFLYNRIIIVTKSGLSYNYYALKDSLIKTSENIPEDINSYVAYFDKIYQFKNGYEFPLFGLKTKNHEDKRLYIFDKREKNEFQKVSDNYFIEGNFVEVFFDEKLMILTSYTDVDRTDKIITCMDFDLNVSWTIQSSTDLKIGNTDKGIINFTKKDNYLYFTIGDCIFCVDLKTGKLIWSQKY